MKKAKQKTSSLTVHGHEQQLLRLHDAEQLVQILEDPQDHLGFRHLGTRVVAVRAVVDDSVHVEVERVDLGDVRAEDGLVDERIALGEPAVELGDACWAERKRKRERKDEEV